MVDFDAEGPRSIDEGLEESVFDVRFAEYEETVSQLLHVTSFLGFGAVIDMFPVEGSSLQYDL